MTEFDALQATHQQLLSQLEAPADPAEFLKNIRDYIDHVRSEAELIGSPRDRDQLRANLRFWASYIFDKTGTYPNTTLRPASVPPPLPGAPRPPGVDEHPARQGDAVPPQRPGTSRLLVLIAIGGVTLMALLLAAIFLSNLGGSAPIAGAGATPTQPKPPAAATSAPAAVPTTIPTSAPLVPNTPTPTPLRTKTPVPTGSLPPSPIGGTPLSLVYEVITQGPSPFDPTAWVAKLKLKGTGGNGNYILWVNGRRLPNDEFVVDGRGCASVTLDIGVTAGGEATRMKATIKSPLVSCR